MLALIAGGGVLPGLVLRHAGGPVRVLELEGQPSGLPGAKAFRVERLGSVLKELRRAGATEACFAGGIVRPRLDPAAVSAATLPLLPRLLRAAGKGDDGALREVLGLFEEAGMRVRGAQDIVPDLLPVAGVATPAQPAEADRTDAERAVEVVAAMGAADVGQACVVAGRQVLAVEATFGTDWMLASLANRPAAPVGGLLYKAPKPTQDPRVDLPAIGPGTIRAAAAAGLRGIVIAAGGVMVLEREATLAAAAATGLFLWVRPT